MTMFTTFGTLANSNNSVPSRTNQALEIASGITIEDITGPYAA